MPLLLPRGPSTIWRPGDSVAMLIRGKPLRLIKDALERLCGEVGIERSKVFVLSAYGVGSPLRVVLTSLGAQRSVMKSLGKGRPALLRLPANVASLRIKNNARLFFVDGTGNQQKFTAKIGLATSNRSGSLAREIKAHKLLTRICGSTVPMPQLIRYDSSRLNWFVEQFIERCPKLDQGQKAELFLTRHAQHLYGPFVRTQPVANFLKSKRIDMDQLKGVFAKAGATLPRSILSATWPVALLHGDLSEGNMIVTRDDDLYLIDWEKFQRGPVAWEMRKLFHDCPQRVRALLKAVSERGDLDPDTQMQIIFAAELILLAPRRRHRNASYVRLSPHTAHGII